MTEEKFLAELVRGFEQANAEVLEQFSSDKFVVFIFGGLSLTGPEEHDLIGTPSDALAYWWGLHDGEYTKVLWGGGYAQGDSVAWLYRIDSDRVAEDNPHGLSNDDRIAIVYEPEEWGIFDGASFKLHAVWPALHKAS